MGDLTHVPVLLKEAVRALAPGRRGLVVDATYGRGGHSRAILDNLPLDGQLIVMDRDPRAIQQARRDCASDLRVQAVHAPFSRLLEIIRERGRVGEVDAILFDFGVSSPQLDEPARGFSFSHDGPLDMRMDPEHGVSASSWIKCVDEKELVRVLRVYGEERYAKRIARAIKAHVEDAALESTAELARLISEAVPAREKDRHPATRSFQAIRIAVNDELGEIESVLPQALEVLSVGGRMVFISFHSLEDRLVKRFIREQFRGDPYPPDLPVTSDMLRPTLRPVGGATRPSAGEVARNPRARSAVMRVAEKIAHGAAA